MVSSEARRFMCHQTKEVDGWNQVYSRLSTTHGHITDCKLLVCMYWTRLVLVRPCISLTRRLTMVKCGAIYQPYFRGNKAILLFLLLAILPWLNMVSHG